MKAMGTKYILANKFLFDPNTNSLVDGSQDNEVTRLGSNESHILQILIEHKNNVVTREQLHERVWREQGFEVDDSSLTQAISTLRKSLQDSTKSPRFVKTVPKRGYQLICAIENTTVMSPNNQKESINDDEPSTVSEEETISPPPSSKKANKKAITETLPIKLIWLALVIILGMIWYFKAPAPADFRQLAMINDIPVVYPKGQRGLEKWLPDIERCAQFYLAQDEARHTLQKLIVTAEREANITLNFVHSLKHMDETISIILFLNQKDIDALCR